MDVYVSNLQTTVTETQLKNLFKNYGTVFDVRMPKDKNTGFARGIAFVEMPCINEARKAIQCLNGTKLDGKNISVKLAHNKTLSKRPITLREWRGKADHKR